MRESKVNGDADRLDPVACRCRRVGPGSLQAGRYQRGNVLPVKVELRWHGSLGAQWRARVRGGRKTPQAPVRSGSTPKPRTVVKGWKTSNPVLPFFAAFGGCGSARYIRTHPLLPYRVSGTLCDRHARA